MNELGDSLGRQEWKGNEGMLNRKARKEQEKYLLILFIYFNFHKIITIVSIENILVIRC